MSTIARSASRRLGELLMERTGLTHEQVAHALSARSDPRERLGQALVRLGFLSEKALVEALAHQFALPVADVERLTTANREAVALVPEQLARQAQVLAFARNGDTLEVAVSDPLDVLSLDHLRALTGCTLRVWVAQPSELAEAIDQFYSELRATEHLGEILDNIDVTATSAEDQEVDLAALRQRVEDAPVVQLVNLMIAEAIDARASDIHVEPARPRHDPLPHRRRAARGDEAAQNLQMAIVSRIGARRPRHRHPAAAAGTAVCPCTCPTARWTCACRLPTCTVRRS
jgi:type IV pilus assembly protein PilB